MVRSRPWPAAPLLLLSAGPHGKGGAVARGVGVNLGLIQADQAQFEELHFLRHSRCQNKDTGQVVEKAMPESGQGVAVRVAGYGNKPEG